MLSDIRNVYNQQHSNVPTLDLINYNEKEITTRKLIIHLLLRINKKQTMKNNAKFPGKYKRRQRNAELHYVLEENKISKDDSSSQIELKSLGNVKQNEQMKATEENNYKIHQDKETIKIETT